MGTPAEQNKTTAFHYKFTLSDGSVKEIEAAFDARTLALIHRKRETYPEWTRLSFQQCPNCPLNEESCPRCPVAANLVDVMELFKDSISFDEADIEIATGARTYRKHTTLQKGISSLIGIYMVTSGCPVMDKLKPMVATHLPFATTGETLYRAVSMYLLAQYFMAKKGQTPDWELKKLLQTYEAVQTVNRGFCQRLRTTSIQDAILNAVVCLNLYAELATLELEIKDLDTLECLFEAYLKQPAP